MLDLSPPWVRSMINQEHYGGDAAARERSLEALSHHTIKVSDMPTTDLLRHLPAAVEFITAALSGGGTCLVHCMAGISRSTTVRPALLALRLLKWRRHCLVHCMAGKSRSTSVRPALLTPRFSCIKLAQGLLGVEASGSTMACLPGLELFSFVSLYSLARLWDRPSH